MNQNKKKLILFDIDGTLLDRHNRIPDSAKQAIFDLKEAGHTVALASGRSPFMLEHLRKELMLQSYVSFNGQYVMHNNELIYSNPIESTVLTELAEFSAQLEHPLVYLDAKEMCCTQKYHQYVDTCMTALHVSHPTHDPLFMRGRKIYQTMLFCTEAEQSLYQETFDSLKFVRWHPFSMDVLPQGGSKAVGIEQLMDRTGFHPDDVYAFGDNYNDIEMFQYVGCSIAMGNAPNLVKEQATFITTEAGQDGIWHGLKWAGLL